MSNLLISAALIKAVKDNTNEASVDLVFEDMDFQPTPGRPYEEVLVLFARPDNPTFGDGYFRERGILKVVLRYPSKTGKKNSGDRIEVFRTVFKRGTTLVNGPSKVIIDKTPEIGHGFNLHDRWVIPITIPWYSEAIS